METAKIIGLLAIAVVSQSIGNVLLSMGMKELAGKVATGMAAWGGLLYHMVTSPAILIGAALFVVFFILWMTALSRADLSFVLPAVSFEVVLNVAFANWFLQETISPIRWAGVALISIGVLLVLRSGTRSFNRSTSPALALEEGQG